MTNLRINLREKQLIHFHFEKPIMNNNLCDVGKIYIAVAKKTSITIIFCNYVFQN